MTRLPSPSPNKMTSRHSGNRSKELPLSNEFHVIKSSVLLWITFGHMQFHQMSFNDILHAYIINYLCMSFRNLAHLILNSVTKSEFGRGIFSTFFWKYLSIFVGHLPICVSFTNDDMQHLCRSLAFKQPKSLCNISLVSVYSRAEIISTAFFRIVLFIFLSSSYYTVQYHMWSQRILMQNEAALHFSYLFYVIEHPKILQQRVTDRLDMFYLY